jgi:hypothetical protein
MIQNFILITLQTKKDISLTANPLVLLAIAFCARNIRGAICPTFSRQKKWRQ